MLFENLELHEIKAGPGSSDVNKGRSFRDLLKAKAAKHFVLEKKLSNSLRKLQHWNSDEQWFRK